MKRNKIILVTLLVPLVISLVFLFFFYKVSRIKTPAIHAIPADAEFILEVFNPFETGRRNLQLPFWKLADSISSIQSFIKDFNDLDSLIRTNEKTQEFFRETTLYISSHPFHHQTQWLFVCNINKTIKSHFIDQFVVKANKDYQLEKIETDYGTIKRIQLSDKKRFLHYALKNNIWIASMHLEQVKSALKTIAEKNGYTAQPNYEKLMKLHPENTGITAITNIKGLLCWASRIWELEAIRPTMEQFSIPGHYTLRFDSLNIHAKGIHPLSELLLIENELPDVATDWNMETRFIPAEVHTTLSFHISPALFKQSDQTWLTKLHGCAHMLLYTDFSERFTWLVLPVDDEIFGLLEEISDLVIIDSLVGDYPIAWGYISQKDKDVIKQLPFHAIDTSWNVAGMLQNRLLLANSKESLYMYHRELNRQTMADNDNFIKSVQRNGQSKFSWQLWFKPFSIQTSEELTQNKLLASLIESVCIQWSNRKELVRVSADVYFSEQKASKTLPAWEISLGGKITTDPIILIGKDTTILVFASDNVLYNIHLREGKINWKRQFNETLSSPMQAVYWKGKEMPQALFSCGSKIYLVSADGKDAPGFPVDMKVPVSIISIVKDLFVAKTTKNELWVITPQGSSSIFNSNLSEGNYYCGKPGDELTCMWLGKNGAITVFRNQRVLFELVEWNSDIYSNVFVIWNKTLESSAIVFSDNSNQLVIRYLDKIKKPDIIQRKQPTMLLYYRDFDQDGLNDFLIVEDNFLRIINRNNEVLKEAKLPFKGASMVVKSISGNYLLLLDGNKNLQYVINLENLTPLKELRFYSKIGILQSSNSNDTIIFITSDGFNNLIFFEISI
ncbi:MAG: hypothetical protein N2167_10280 [Flavobacteriales bacterium]|nr:hypothetical protein [Flavobacteriales bacterium]